MNEPIETTVDSEIARFYLESYLPQQKTTHHYYRDITALHRKYASKLPTREQLKRISQQYSVDLAALLFADKLANEPCNKALNDAFRRYVANVTPVNPTLADEYVILFIPGWNYVETGRFTGADFALPRRLATNNGLENYLVAIPSMGSVSENAAVLAQEIRNHAASGKEIILAGASSAGPAILLTLGKLLSDDERQPVRAWLNLGGILQGSPLVDILQRPPRRWAFDFVVWSEGWDKEALVSMSAEVSRKRFTELPELSDILTINYLGVPLSGQLSAFAQDNYLLLKSEGPNDGFTLLPDAIAPNSHTIVAFGRDHFFAEDPKIHVKTVALMSLIIDSLERARDGSAESLWIKVDSQVCKRSR